MTCVKRVVNAFTALREASQTVLLTDCVNLLVASRQHFVNIALMTHVPDNAVLGAVEALVKHNRELDYAEV